MKPRTARVVQVSRIPKEQLRIGLLLYPERVVGRPRTRADCEDGQRPCPYAGCRYHLGFEVRASGSLVEVFGDTEVWDMSHTCALDEAKVPRTLDEIGAMLGMTRERIRQIEEEALAKLRELDTLALDDLPDDPLEAPSLFAILARR